MQKTPNRLVMRRAFLIALLGTLQVGVIGYIDYLNGDYSMLIFYAIPVALNAWFLGDCGAVALSLASGSARFISDYYSYSPNDFRYWNSIEDMVYLMIFGLVLSSVKRVLAEEERSLSAAKID